MFMANYSIALHTISKIQNSAKREIAKNSTCNTNVLISQCHIDSAYPWAKLNIQLTNFNAYTSL